MIRKHKENFSDVINTGSGGQAQGGRLISKSGEARLRKTGLPILERISIYHTLLRMTTGEFLLFIFVLYTSINIIFATIYYAVGVDHLLGADGSASTMHKFLDAFFFSSQTLTTVGYGHVAPTGIAANFVASFESLVGILIFALVTGLIYGRFARPRAYISFSQNAIIAPYKNGRAIMFRIATYKNNNLTDVEAQLNAAIQEHDNGKEITRFFSLPLELSKISSMALSWTLVHYLNEDSPLFEYTEKEFKENKIELVAAIKAFDDHFSNIVQQRTSYTNEEIIYGAKFVPMFHKAPDGSHTILELHKINAHEKITLNEPKIEVTDKGSLSVKP
jgi:inward rectifier potassium channel